MPVLRAGGADRARRSCASSATSATCGGTCRSATSIRRPSSPPRRPRPPEPRTPSGRCTTRCSTHQDALRPRDLLGYAEELGLDLDRFRNDLREHTGAGQVAEDVDSADLSGVSGTPTFFINGRRHYGAYDGDALLTAVRAARAQAALRGDDTG